MCMHRGSAGRSCSNGDLIIAMNGDLLGLEIATLITDSRATPEVKAQVLQLWQKIAGAIVGHIQTNAVVLPGISLTVDPITHQGSTTGPGKVM